MSDRWSDIRKFYELLGHLALKTGGPRVLHACTSWSRWPRRGVYFFMEDGEVRSESGNGPRVVRVGTHALTGKSTTSLWNRLSQHRGARTGGGNHRGSVFRLLVGNALIARNMYELPTWGVGNSAQAAVVANERPLELEVKRIIGTMPFLWLAVPDEPGPASFRGLIERNSIGLLSNYGKLPIDAPSNGWLGMYSDRERVRKSGLWNNNHVDEGYTPDFLFVLERLVDEMDGPV